MYVKLPEGVPEHFEKNGIALFYADEVDSTNKRAREYAESLAEPLKRAALFVAERQSEGRGRLGRSFFSPASTGLYMTLLFEAPENADCFSKITALAAVAAREAVAEIFKTELKIKWVNDLYLDGKKVAGILAESFFEGERRYVALGIGINLTTEDFPDDIKGKAGSLASGIEDEELCAMKMALAFSVSQKFLAAIGGADFSEGMKKYREASCVIGKRIRFSLNGSECEGVAVDITDGGALAVRRDGGDITELGAGEISVFSLDGKWN